VLGGGGGGVGGRIPTLYIQFLLSFKEQLFLLFLF
jgi:hypothetical protein